MKKLLMIAGCFVTLMTLVHASHADIVVTTTQTDDAAGPAISVFDLAQSAFESSSTTNNSPTNTGPMDGSGLFNGEIGTTNSPTDADPATTLELNDFVILNLDVTTNTLGYDITGIDTVFGWNQEAGGRSNQGYSISLVFVNGSVATLVDGQHWEPNDPAAYWTTVSFADGSGGTLFSDTVELNGGGATGGTNVLATGVRGIFWGITNPANASAVNGVLVAREFDVFGTPTTAAVPEPSSLTVLALLAGVTLVRRRR